MHGILLSDCYRSVNFRKQNPPYRRPVTNVTSLRDLVGFCVRFYHSISASNLTKIYIESQAEKEITENRLQISEKT